MSKDKIDDFIKPTLNKCFQCVSVGMYIKILTDCASKLAKVYSFTCKVGGYFDHWLKNVN